MPTPSPLFDDDPVVTASGVSLVGRAPRFSQSKKAKTVNRLLAEVEALRERFEAEKRRLDEALIFLAAHVTPRRQRVTALRADMVRRLARSLDDRRLVKADRRVLRAILMEQIDEVLVHVVTPDQEIAELFQRLHGLGYEDAVQSELDEVRSEIADFFDALGLDPNVPDLRADMTEEDIAACAAQMADRMRQLHEVRAEGARGRRKTKRELREERRAERYERLRKTSIGAIYKRLVKVLHPDRELDPALRERKVEVMQEVTTAYAGNDLHTLLRLELEWIEGQESDAERRTDEMLNAYAEVLRQQVAQLRTDTMDLPFHPRYAPLVVDDGAFGHVCLIDGRAEVGRLDAIIDGLTGGLERLSDERQALLEIRDLIRTHRRERSRQSRRSDSF